MPQNVIPAHSGVSAAQAAAGGGASVQVHQGAPAGIPAHPDAIAQRAAATAPPVQNPAPSREAVAADFFARTALGDDEAEDLSQFESPPSGGAPPPAPSSQPSTDLVNVDDLLGGGQFPQEPPEAHQPQAPQGAPQPQGVQQPQQQPVQQQMAPPQQQQQQQQDPTPEQLQTAAIDYLRGNTYKFDDAMARQALTEPEVVLPQLAARLHVNLVQEFATQMQRVLPTLVEREVQRRTASMEAKNEFFRRYPKLNNPAWYGVITESLQMASQLHAGKPREVIMQEGAALSAYRIRGQAPRAPAAPGRPQPFVPANPGGGGMQVPTNPTGVNPWDQFSGDPDLFEF